MRRALQVLSSVPADSHSCLLGLSSEIAERAQLVTAELSGLVAGLREAVEEDDRLNAAGLVSGLELGLSGWWAWFVGARMDRLNAAGLVSGWSGDLWVRAGRHAWID